MLAAIVGFNLLNLPFFIAGIAGPKPWLAHHPELIVGSVALQIVVTLIVVGVLARRPVRPGAPRRDEIPA